MLVALLGISIVDGFDITLHTAAVEASPLELVADDLALLRLS